MRPSLQEYQDAFREFIIIKGFELEHIEDGEFEFEFSGEYFKWRISMPFKSVNEIILRELSPILGHVFWASKFKDGENDHDKIRSFVKHVAESRNGEQKDERIFIKVENGKITCHEVNMALENILVALRIADENTGWERTFIETQSTLMSFYSLGVECIIKSNASAKKKPVKKTAKKK